MVFINLLQDAGFDKRTKKIDENPLLYPSKWEVM